MQLTNKGNRLPTQPDNSGGSVVQGGLVVRTNLCAGLAWDDLDDKALDLWNDLTRAISNTAQSITGETAASS